MADSEAVPQSAADEVKDKEEVEKAEDAEGAEAKTGDEAEAAQEGEEKNEEEGTTEETAEAKNEEEGGGTEAAVDGGDEKEADDAEAKEDDTPAQEEDTPAQEEDTPAQEGDAAEEAKEEPEAEAEPEAEPAAETTQEEAGDAEDKEEQDEAEVETEEAPQEEEPAEEEEKEEEEEEATPQDEDAGGEEKGAAELSEEERERYRQIFDRRAVNGRLDLKGFKVLFRLMGEVVTSEDAEQMFEDGDKDDDGTIDFDEYCRLYSKFSEAEQARKETLMSSIDTLFPNSDGEPVELRKVERLLMKLQQPDLGMKLVREKSDLGADDIRSLVRSMDTDGNGLISKQEFVNTLCQHLDM